MGRRFFKGAVPYGGPCWPRDNVALTSFMDAIGVPSRLPEAVDLFNRDHALYVLRKVLRLSATGQTVGIIGLAYKPGTPAIDHSFAMDLAEWLVQAGRTVIGWDPLAASEARRRAGHVMTLTDCAEDCLRQSSVAVIVNPLNELHDIDWSSASRTMVIDCWRCLSSDAFSQVERYVPLGTGPTGSVGDWLGQVMGSDLDLLTD
jgi:UDPglucose 6-dehydrogenase